MNVCTFPDTRPPPSRHRPPIRTPSDKSSPPTAPPPARFPRPRQAGVPAPSGGAGVWAWLSRRAAPTPQQLAPSSPAAENHYTHMEEQPYDGGGGGDEALYAELDQGGSSPAYQNSAYADPEVPGGSSAPSSAYYSDLSEGAAPGGGAAQERAYEVVGLSTLPVWEGQQQEGAGKRQPRLAAICESIGVPSDYV